MRDPEELLRAHWGYEGFRPLQREIIGSVLEGKDCLAVLPTGGGKSICFQVPALANEGICLVVSPLIALMKDQVENLKKRGIPALMIHSGMQRSDVIQTFKNATHSYFKFLYVSPERLETSLFHEYLPSLQVNLIAVDEAHCISQWGYDFRPSYLRIAALREELPGVPLLALTASATPEVQKDICEKLELARPEIFRQSFARPNLSYSVFQVDSKMAKLVDILSRLSGSAIVYCKSRKRTTEIARLLEQQGISSGYYHAGLDAAERSRRQQDWVSGRVRVIACTNAFGMGIDKPDVRCVIHLDSPDCLENYYQEAGRAGRDGNKSYAVLLFEKRDRNELLQQHITRYPGLEQIRHVYQCLVNFLQVPVHSGQDQSIPFQFDRFVQNFKLESLTALYSLKALETDGWLEFNERSFAPSTLVFTTGKQGLYEFERSYPQYEAILTTLLRTYEGIFDFPVFIIESVIARLMKITEDEVKKQLKLISSYGIIRYTPQNPDPHIIFRKQRVAATDLTFNLLAYYKRRDHFVERTKKMVGYIESQNCRSTFISGYFGESGAKDCGICDNCLSKKNTELSTAEFNSLSQAILFHLSGEGMGFDELLRALSVKKEKAWRVINYLQAENKLSVDGSSHIRLKLI